MRLDAETLGRLAAEAGLEPASLAVVPLAGGAPALFDPDRPLYPASMIKVPLAAAALTEVASGRLRLDQPVPIEERNMTANDLASPLVPGYVATLDELLLTAVSRSDNVATNALFDVLGRERATAIVRDRLGLRSTLFARKLSGSDPLIHDPDWDGTARNAHPASDAAALFGAIAREEIPLAAHLRAMLDRQAWNDKLSAGLRPGDCFAHKTGDTSDVTHDGGILVTVEGKAYAVVAYTGLASSDEHNARFAPFMREVREYL